MNDLMTKSFLSYKDLKKEALKDIDLESGPAVTDSLELELASTDSHLRTFFEEAELIREEMAAIRTLLVSLHAASDSAKSLHNPDSLRALRDRTNADILQVLRTARTIRDRLESMDRANAANRRLSGCKEGTPVDRTRSSIANGLRLKLKDLMMDFQALRQRMMAEYKETVERRYFTVTGEAASDEVIERIISDGESEEMLQKAARGEVVAAVHEIQDRYGAAKEVERSLLELHQVFLDMAVLVETQGERMDDIEHHVSSASDYVRNGTKQLKTAKAHQKSSRRWLCIGVVLLLVLVMVVLVPIVVSFRGS